jgi:hypothetical protein
VIVRMKHARHTCALAIGIDGEDRWKGRHFPTAARLATRASPMCALAGDITRGPQWLGR